MRDHDEQTGPAYLKSAQEAVAKDLGREAERLRWIGERRPVDKDLSFVEGETSFLLLSELRGAPAHTWIGRLGAKSVIEVVAPTLVSLHALPIVDCPFEGLLESEVSEAEGRLADWLVVRTDLKESYGEMPEVSLAWLRSDTSFVRDMVFTHGDFCHPNVLIEDRKISGIVDWGLAGIADRHRT